MQFTDQIWRSVRQWLLFIVATGFFSQAVGQNLPPIAVDDENYTDEDIPVSGNLAANDSDPNLDALTYTLVQGSNDGFLQLNTDGSYTYYPYLDEYGIEFFTYQVCDPYGLCSTANLAIAVFFVNDPPICVDDVVVVEMNSQITGNVVSNDIEYDNEPLDFDLLISPQHGTLNLYLNGSFTYTPYVGYTGPDVFLVQGCDPCIICDQSWVNITVIPPNAPPTANNDFKFLNEDTTGNGNASTNDSDPENDPLTYTVVSLPLHGNLVMQANGIYSYTPAAHYSGDDFALYQACDPYGHCDQAQITFEIAEVNDPPIAIDDLYTGNEDVTIYGNVTSNDIEYENELLIVELMNDVDNGNLVLNADGSFSYTPNLDWLGTDSFSYLIIDPCGAGDFGSVSVIINNVNDIPVAVSDTKTLAEDNSASGTVASNDSDADNELLTYSLITEPQYGEIIFNENGTYLFTPFTNFFGSDFLVYQACDPNGACVQALLTFTVTDVNDAPMAFNDYYTGNEDELMLGNILLNDTDIENNDLTCEVITTTPVGILVVSDDGDFAFTPPANWYGTVMATYVAIDTWGAQSQGMIVIELVPVNDIPVAGDDYNTGNEDESVSGSLSANDYDADGESLTYQVTNNVDHGIFMLFPDGSYTYIPQANWFGIDQATYIAIDPNGTSNPATLTLSVSSINDEPVALNDNTSVMEDNVAAGSVATNDNDVENDILIYSLLDSPQSGNINFLTNGSFTYTPDANFFGIETLQYVVSDPSGASDYATLTITVWSVNDPPVAGNDSQNIGEDQTENGNLAVNDYDVDGQVLTYTIIDNADFGEFNLNANGTFSYSPDTDFTGTDAVVYQVCDPMMSCTTATLTLNIGESNDIPFPLADIFETEEDQILAGSVANDYDADGDMLIYSLIDAPMMGELSMNDEGDFTYTPAANFYGIFAATYSVCDIYNACATGNLSITVNAVNDLPEVNGEAYTLWEDNAGSGNVSGNDSDAETTTLTYSTIQQPAIGFFALDPYGNYFFQPPANYFGSATATYSACDGQGACTNATILFEVLSVDDAPVTTPGTEMVLEDSSVDGSVLAFVSDPDSGVLTLTLDTAPANGDFLFAADGSYTYTPFANYYGNDYFGYSVCDEQGLCTTGYVDIEVTFLNDFPIAADDYATGIANQWLFGTVATNDVELDQEPSFFQVLSTADNGQFNMNPDGSFSYLPNDSFTGFESLTYLVCDSCNACDAAVLYITIEEANNAPIALSNTYTICQDNALNIFLNSLVSDADEPDIYLHITGATASSGTIEAVDVNNSLAYVPEAGFAGEVAVTYTVCDNGEPQLCATGVITIDVSTAIEPLIEEVNITHELCFGDETGSIDIAISNAGDEYDIEWSNNEETEDLTGLEAGDYTVEVTSLEECGSTSVQTFTINEPESPLEIVGLEADNINETPGGSSAYEVNGGTPPYNFLWTNSDGETISTEQQLTLTEVADAGDYQLTVTDSNGCSVWQGISVTSINKFRNQFHIAISPNPVADHLYISVPGNFNFVGSIFDASGRMLMKEKNAEVFNLSQLGAGIYFLEIETAGLSTTRFSFLKL